MTVVVVGASDNPERFSHRALLLLKASGHQVIPIHPKLGEIEGLPVRHSLKEVRGPVDTVTLYVGSERSQAMADDLKALRPRRVIFNPGAENAVLEETLSVSGIQVVRGCTIVMLNSKTF